MDWRLVTYYVAAFHLAGYMWAVEWLAGAFLTAVLIGGLVADLHEATRT